MTSRPPVVRLTSTDHSYLLFLPFFLSSSLVSTYSIPDYLTLVPLYYFFMTTVLCL